LGRVREGSLNQQNFPDTALGQYKRALGMEYALGERGTPDDVEFGEYCAVGACAEKNYPVGQLT
ncbi:MAG: hypothetical protein KDE31_21240, partial [Caldilineaceae bacterium]|nr:hypothetical protein [Caldilineaceae bacterium]